MSLKQSIVIKTEFTIKGKDGTGSRGSTPGRYVLRYMAREKATERLSPVRVLNADGTFKKYDDRSELSEDLSVDTDGLKRNMREAQGLGGIGFGNGCPSLSEEELMRRSDMLQKAFDEGKPVMKTVISLDEDYLREMKIISDDFKCEHRGDYRGNIDQLKLRLAIMEGLGNMGYDYDDLQYVGVIQVDTGHVHCHLAMADMGRGNIRPDGQQRGMLKEKTMARFRRGMDGFLDENKTVNRMAQHVSEDRVNVKAYVKKHTHEMLRENDVPQFLLACLPEDKNRWRAGTNAKDMQKANTIVREYVRQLWLEPGSGYHEALRDIDEYAETRKKREGLSDNEYERLRAGGRKRLLNDCMNGVYGMLRTVPDSERQTSTEMMDLMSMPYTDMAALVEDDPLTAFGFRLRSYGGRLRHHRKEADKWRENVKGYETAKSAGQTDPASVPLYNFMVYEQQYQEMLMCKYQYFLKFLPPGERWKKQFDELMEYKKRMRDLDAMRKDRSMPHMSPERAEEYGMKMYGQHGGRFVKDRGHILDTRVEKMRIGYALKEDDFRFQLSCLGLSLQKKKKKQDGASEMLDEESAVNPGEERLAVSSEKTWAFDDVKALDIHHLGYDFGRPIEISRPNIDIFKKAADERFRLLTDASKYLIESGQEARLHDLPLKDVTIMKEAADKFSSGEIILTDARASGEDGGKRRAKTVSLDTQLKPDFAFAIKSAIQANQLENE